jgi:hypothetical protein
MEETMKQSARAVSAIELHVKSRGKVPRHGLEFHPQPRKGEIWVLLREGPIKGEIQAARRRLKFEIE